MTHPHKPLYPRGFTTPAGKNVSISGMAAALRVIRRNPDRDYPGWNWYETPGYHILSAFRSGLHDRINRRAADRVRGAAS